MKKLLFVVVLLLMASLVTAKTIDMNNQTIITSDSKVNSDDTTANYGSQVLTIHSLSSGGVRTYIKIDFKNLTVSSVRNAVLYTNYKAGDLGGTNYRVIFFNSSNWTESSITWNNQPCGSVGGVVSGPCNLSMYVTNVTASTGNIAWNITNALQWAVNLSRTNVTLMTFHSLETISSSGADYESKDTGGAAMYISLTYEDEPSVQLIYPSNNSNLPFNTNWTWINVTTTYPSVCAWNRTLQSFSSMTNFSNTGGLVHSFNFTNATTSLKNGVQYNVSVSCKQNSTNRTYNVSFNFNVYNVQFGACPAGSANAVNFTFYNESNLNRLNASFQATFMLYSPNNLFTPINYTVNISNVANYSLCLVPSTINVTTNMRMSYTTIGGFTQRWYLINAVLTNITSQVNIYGTDYQPIFSELRGSTKHATDYSTWSGIYTVLNRFYPATNQYITVQMDKSDEYGQFFFNVIEESVDYQMMFLDGNTIIKTTDDIKFLCDPVTFVCELTVLLTEPAGNFSGVNAQTSWYYNNATKIYYFNFTDTSGLASNVRLIISQASDNKVLCNTSKSISSITVANLSCNLAGADGTVMVRVYYSASPETLSFLDWLVILTRTHISDLTSKGDRYLIVGVLSAVMITAGAASPVGSLIMFIVNLIAVKYLGLIDVVTVSFITISVLITLVLVWVTRKDG